MLMTLVIFLFAFSSILGNYAYADGNLTYLGASAPMVTAFRVIVLVAVAGGSLAALPTVWSVADVAMGLMALVNLVAILLLGRWAPWPIRGSYARQDPIVQIQGQPASAGQDRDRGLAP